MRWVLCISLLLISLQVVGQEGGSTPGLSIRFSRQNNFTWLSNHDFNYKLKRDRYRMDLRIHHDNIYNSSVTQNRFFQFYFNSSFWQYFRIAEKLEATTWLETDQFMNSNNEKYNVYGGVSWSPNASVRITPLIGYTVDRRDTAYDHGPTGAVLVQVDHRTKDDLRVFLKALARYKWIQPRRQRNIRLEHFWRKVFAGQSKLSAELNASSHELDNYQGLSVQRIISDTVAPGINLDYQIMKGLVWSSENQLMLFQRFFKYQTLRPGNAEFNDISYRGFNVRSFQQLSLVTEKLNVLGYYEYRFQNRFYEVENSRDDPEAIFQNQIEREKGKDFVRNIHRLEFNSNLRVSERHVVNARYTAQYMQYDTPGLNNFDDRDELSYVAVVGIRTKWNRRFSTNFRMLGNYRHLAFLFAEKSQDNYIQRSLRFDHGYIWDIHQKVRLEGSNAVYVTYNVKDFEDFNLTDRSTRNLETNVKLTVRPIRDLTSRIMLNRKIMHQSYLNWVAFSETTLDTTYFMVFEQSNRYEFRLEKKRLVLNLEVGVKHYRQAKRLQSTMYDEQGNVVPIFLKQINMQTGPIIQFGFRNAKRWTLQMQSWFQFQIGRNRFEEGGVVSTLSPPQLETELRKVNTKLRPFVQLNLTMPLK